MSGVAMADQTEKPWKDWTITGVESDLDAGWYVKNEKIFQGYSKTEFRPNENIKLMHFQTVLTRAGIAWSLDDFMPITEDAVRIKTAQKIMPGTAWSANPEEAVTRFRAAVMIYRHANGIVNPNPVDPDKEVIEKLEQLFLDKPVTWQGVTRQSKLIGLAGVIVKDARQYNIPLWLCLGQGWWETQWYTTGMSLKYNQGWGMKDTQGWGEIIDFHSGFANYVSVEESIHAYFKLMSSPDMPYRAWIDKLMAGDESYLRTILQAYCVNSISAHLATVKTVRDWCNERGIR